MNLKKWKAIKLAVLNVAVIGFGVFALTKGAEPTTVSLAIVLTVGLLNGMEAAELVDAWREVRTQQAQQLPESDSNTDD